MSFIVASLSYVYRLLLSVRYRVKVTGDPFLPSKKGTLIVANHPALIDPCILTAYLWPKIRFHPIAADFLEQNALIRWVLSFYGTIFVPVFDEVSNSYKRYRIEQAYKKVVAKLKKGRTVLLYPAGGLKVSGEEIIGGASGLHRILQEVPDVELYLVRTEGLWGSQFSKALSGKAPDIMSSFLRGAKIALRNALFFTPKRRVTVECRYAPHEFPKKGKKREINAYLEKWFNEQGPEPLTLISYSCLGVVLPTIYQKPKEPEIDLETVPESVKQTVFSEIAQLASIPVEQISAEQDLALDLGLDSLDRSQLTLLLKEAFGVPGILGSQLTTVGSVLGYASKQLKEDPEDEIELEFKTPDWDYIASRPEVTYPSSKTLIGGFLETCDRMSDWVAAVDFALGVMTYRKLKFGIIAFAHHLSHLPEKHIGVLLPSSIAANMVILAIQLAGKVPVMINWTLGGRNLKSIIQQTDIQTTISSWRFLDQLDNTDLEGIDQQILTLEDIKQKLSLMDKIRTFALSLRTAPGIMRHFRMHTKTGEETAVILFTSGTESLPKGVPLSHNNIMENHRAALTMIEIREYDAILSCLPPFHSFGFSITGLFPLLMGWRVAYMPNPMQGRRLAAAIKRWKLTAICLVPTFLRMLLRASSPDQLETLRLVISGAEQCPDQLKEAFRQQIPGVEIIEGYGVTECAPVLALNPPPATEPGVGLPLPGVALKIVHPETHVPCAQGEVGLVLAAGPNVFKGYLNGAIASPFLELEGQQWYVTGDLGSLNAKGYLILAGRLKRFVKIGGEMVSLEAIEYVLNSFAKQEQWAMPAEDAPALAVCAVEDEEAKAELHLFTVFPIQKNRVNELLREGGMSNLIRITSVHEISHIPLLGTGKINYRQLTEKLVNLQK